MESQCAGSAGSVVFDFYGLKLELRSEDLEAVDSIRRDFAYFKSAPAQPHVTVEVFKDRPDFSALPDLRGSIYTMDYVCYLGRDEVYTDYHGNGLKISDPKRRSYRIYSESADVRHEISYLTIQAAVGEYLDSRHIHRVHALAISKNGKAVLVLLPEKGGKSTLAFQLLKSDQVRLLSDESPLITRQGEILPFPMRMGFLPGAQTDIPSEYLQPVNYMRVGTKIRVDVEYYADKIGSACPVGAILLGERSLGCGCTIEPASRLSGSKEFIKNSVVGLGLHQGMDYLLGRNLRDTFGKVGLASSRLYNSLVVLRRSRVFRYTIGHDRQRNMEVLLDFLEGLSV